MVAAHVLKSTHGSTHNIQAALVRIDFCDMMSNARCNQEGNFDTIIGSKQWESMTCVLPNHIVRDMRKWPMSLYLTMYIASK